MTQCSPPSLKDLLEFPALIPVKAVSHKGITESEFIQAMLDVTAQLVPGFHSGLLSIRASNGGNYYAVTLSVTVQSPEQFHALDQALRAHPLVRMVL